MTARPPIRRATGKDMAALLPLCVEHAAYERIGHALQDRADALAIALDAAPPRVHAWLAWNGEQAVAYATATVDFSTLDAAPFLHMDCLYVREAWRGRGVGLELFDALRNFAVSCGCYAMQWQTPVWNESAARFYGRLGASEKTKRSFTLALDRAGVGSPSRRPCEP